MNAAFAGLRDQFLGFWQERDARERKILAAAAAFLLLVLLWLIFVNPALSGRAQLAKTLPAMRQQAAELQAMAAQAAQAGQSAGPPPAPLSREGLETALTRHTLKAQNLVVTGELVKLQLANASFASLMGWVDEMQRAQRLVVAEASVDAQDKPDTVNATLTLRQQVAEQ